MKKITDIIISDFQIAFSSLFTPATGIDADFLLETSYEYILNELKSLNGVPGVIEQERKNLLEFMVLVKKLEGGTYLPQIEKEYLEFIECNNYTQQTFKLMLFLYQVEGLVENGYTSDELVIFYESIFHQPDLVNLNDFFSEIKALIPLLLATRIPDRIVEIFQIANQNHPDKIILKFIIARIYEVKKKYIDAIDFYVRFIELFQSPMNYDMDGLNDTEEYVLALNSLSELHFKTGNYDVALDFSQILQNRHDPDDDSIYAFQYYIVNPLTLKLRCYMALDNNDDFITTYKILQEKVDESDIEQMNITDIIDYSRKIN